MSKEQEQEINKWDEPSENDLFGREAFVDTISKTILSSKEGINFGISAKWGEGKSSILKQLKPKLEANNFKVLNFEPWKYTQDQTSVKRKFLIDIYKQLGKDLDEILLYTEKEKEEELTSKEQNQKLFQYGVRFITYFIFSLGLLWFFVAVWHALVDSTISISKTILSNLFLPIILAFVPLIQKITEIKVKQTIPKIESAEQFEDKFNVAIKEIMALEKPPKHIIIFVDDLDRCNHKEVEQVLTALFTFFNNKKVTYVITADHTVIRRYIANFLHLEDEVDSKGQIDFIKTNEFRQKAATEYLKKIFQINFILPDISSDLLEPWIKNLIAVNPVIEEKNSYAKQYLVNLIMTNFDHNPRKIKHFMRALVFQLDAVIKKISQLPTIDSAEKDNLKKIQESPELLAKVLIIQDRFPDFYEKLKKEPRLLQKHEEGLVDPDTDLQNLIAQEPKFFNSATRVGSLKTIDPYYFIYFSGATGYDESKGVDPAEVKAFARKGDFNGLEKIIGGLTDVPRNIQIESIKSELSSPQVLPPEKVNIIRSLFHVIGLLEEQSLRLSKLKDFLNLKGSYPTEFSALQSVDFESFLSVVDKEISNQLLTEQPFSDANMQNQILNAFISKQEAVTNTEVTDVFLESIANGLKKHEDRFLDLIKRINLNNFKNSNSIQDALLETSKNAPEPLRQNIFNTIIDFKVNFSNERQKQFEANLSEIIENNSIGEVIAMLGNIPTKINKTNFDFSKFIPPVKKRISTLNNSELEQLVNILIHPAVKDEIGSKNMEQIFASLVEVVDDGDPARRSYVRGKLPNIISYTENKSGLLKQIVQSISKGTIAESSQTLSVVQGMSDFWNANPELKKEFAKELKTGANKATEKEVKEVMIKSSNELIPPPEPKSKKN